MHTINLLLKISTPLEVALVHGSGGAAYHLSEIAQDQLYPFDVHEQQLPHHDASNSEHQVLDLKQKTGLERNRDRPFAFKTLPILVV